MKRISEQTFENGIIWQYEADENHTTDEIIRALRRTLQLNYECSKANFESMHGLFYSVPIVIDFYISKNLILITSTRNNPVDIGKFEEIFQEYLEQAK